ncbi:venom carboxylesterase-6-like isoform X25 [Aethina tumida]|uniref:venom carboxylesterase-6-like isoform X25 n=1 Tax=Aethina tumida TaxID=116153 RepID=UPI0021496289|nr:venom carboxylesterase-6-like isoform X25 [Aethina tumida]
MQVSITCIFVAFLIGVHSKDDPPIVQTSAGPVLGTQTTISSNLTIFSFKGIPYAEPPVGNLRFEPPVPKSPWNQTINATDFRSSCIQEDGTGAEDCLYVNVYSPNLTGNLPVMVWIYGGTFVSGAGTEDPAYIVDKNVVFVAFNYRLGLFGFISTGDLVAPGNAGLKDQVLALKWVQSNIAKFGGNPRNVTIWGESAGAVSVSYLVQSNLTAGLFQGAIMESGTTLIPWALTSNARETAFNVGEKLLIFTSDSRTLINALKQVDANKLHQFSSVNYLFLIPVRNPLNGLPYGPVMEPDHEGAVFSSKSYELLQNGNFHKVPMIIGYNSEEAVYVSQIPDLLKWLLIKYDYQPTSLVPNDMNVKSSFVKWIVGNIIKFHYFGLDLILSSSSKLAQFVSDDQFNRPVNEQVRLQSMLTPVYFYVFSYQGVLGTTTNRTMPGVGHAEELRYLFKGNQTNVDASDQRTIRRMTTMWTNFAKFGTPTPNQDSLLDDVIWEPARSSNSSSDLTYLNIGSNLNLGVNPNHQAVQFYQYLYKMFGNPPYTTY